MSNLCKIYVNFFGRDFHCTNSRLGLETFTGEQGAALSLIRMHCIVNLCAWDTSPCPCSG